MSIQQSIIQQQLSASNPNHHVWVNASAGSGKTKVLVDRILRLLLQGATPSSILCITFTKAGAVEMRSRLNQQLEKWIFLTDPQLLKTLESLDPDISLSPSYLKRARGLLNVVLESPVKIETIHSFAQNLVFANLSHTNIPFGAKLMDELQTHELLQSAVNSIIANSNFTQQADLAKVHKVFSQHKFNEIVKKISEEKAFFKYLIANGEAEFVDVLNKQLDMPRSSEAIKLEAEAIIKELTPKELLHNPAASDSDKAWLEQFVSAQLTQNLVTVMQVCLTSAGGLRKRIFSKKLQDAAPEATSNMIEAINSLYSVYDEWKRRHLGESTILVFRLASVLLNAYEGRKLSDGCLDYDDLIFTAISLLSDAEHGADILYQLDMNLQHVLVDEAQDTNVYQWKLIDLIVETFFNQVSDKTLFVVGDHKQAIFGFQGTDPEIFHTMKQYYASKTSDKHWQDVSLNTSFRSLSSILRFVDGVFSDETLINLYSKHHAFFGEGGRVVQHALVVAENEESNHYEEFAKSVVDQVNECIQRGYVYSDILMLIRKRGVQLDYVQNALTQQGIPFSSPNKKSLFEDELVQLIALLLVLHVQPYDTAVCVHILLNPLLESKEKAIGFALANAQETQEKPSIYDVLPQLKDVVESLRMCANVEDKLFVILSWARLNLTITPNQIANVWLLKNYLVNNLDQKKHCFYSELLAHLETLPITQQAYQQLDALNILTVHGAKGLQAKVVMLLDTTQTPVFRSAVLKDTSGDWFLCAAKSDVEPHVYTELKAQLKESELKEYYRLLYVALTRAAEELHVFGVYNKNKVPDACWYALCEKAAQTLNL